MDFYLQQEQSLDYLVELGELPANPFNNFKIKPSLFTPVVEKEAEYEVFNEVEEQRIKEFALKDFARNDELTTALAVVINFSLGLRVGEHTKTDEGCRTIYVVSSVLELFERIRKANLSDKNSGQS
ncbi:MAG: hypothetical protein NC548_02615 [Lachnospiraceae bacterium]|nr:hypothetical protein [Lachnospiraceae bacterium]